MQGQMSIFDFLPDQNEKKPEFIPHDCKHSGHKCNMNELWNIAHTLDDTECPETCCRKCNNTMCGARCNGATVQKTLREIHDIPELSQRWRDEEGWTDHWHYVDEEQPEEEDFYWMVTHWENAKTDGYNHTYGAWVRGKWHFYNSTTRTWRPVERWQEVVCWAEMPSCYWTDDFIVRSTAPIDTEKDIAWWVARR